MVQHILTPTDGSDPSIHAIEQATEIANPSDATIHALAVIPEMTRGAKAQEEWDERVTDALERAHEIADREGLEYEQAKLNGPVAREIVDYATEHDIDLIVMGTHGRSGLHRFLVGSVTRRTIETSPIPVVTVPPEE
ncbi:UspA domain protein (plasmid) [Natrialba magadii ATCC 43099]|uniref:UspA domain protein n=1 Tax=Natrialba magadii (strain ATCC 43099 / DSM 3394 / CCM 3739 / CIP 104546 / IAM 13178 / JCM 8861 / NBRC 102185 / NCIMB 2190 / MS3) TaxID=547559 RepID=D3T1T6_NATMM|nr:universal stress protein [Natrialba magadii]ADD07545.1 UspA domain protein [Natrialba magadii ATCC 43099]ELY26581.1 UspA domain-containing protein [Natrialba magadii ATCC 43099]